MHFDQPLGFARAVNEGALRAKHDALVLLNSDTLVTDGWLDGLRDALLSDSQVGVVSPLTNYAGNPLQVDPKAVSLHPRQVRRYAARLRNSKEWAVPWRPNLRVSGRHLRDLYGYSLSITGNDILWFFTQRSDQTLVGYGFGSLGLGPYSLASRLVTIIHGGIIGPVQSVAFPAFSKLQAEPTRLERALHKFCEMSAFVSLPVFAGMIIVAPELVHCLFGAKWMLV